MNAVKRTVDSIKDAFSNQSRNPLRQLGHDWRYEEEDLNFLIVCTSKPKLESLSQKEDFLTQAFSWDDEGRAPSTKTERWHQASMTL